jgi:ABC-type multidrug transport system fused ATPase/permease subunit
VAYLQQMISTHREEWSSVAHSSTVFFLALAVIGSLALLLSKWFGYWFALHLQNALRKDIFYTVLQKDLGWFESVDAHTPRELGRLISQKVSEVAQIHQLIGQVFFPVVVIMFVSVFFSLLNGFFLTLVLFLILPISLVSLTLYVMTSGKYIHLKRLCLVSINLLF